MEQEALLEQLNEHLDAYGKHQAFMAKATEQAGKFKADVIEKVIADHQIKASLIADDVAPILPEIQAAIAAIDASIAECNDSKGNLGERLEEMELRRAIGELSDSEFEDLSREGRETVETADSKIGDLNADREVLQAALDRWAELSGAEIAVPPPPPPPVDVEPEPAMDDDGMSSEIDESVEVESASDVGFDLDESEGDIDVAEAEGAEAVEVEFDDEDEADDEAEADDEGEADDEDEADDEEAMDEDAAVIVEGEDVAVEINEEGDAAGDPRRALLLYQEGTPEEQIYPFTGEVLTVGRGRDNDIQIKNDSKVSRFHCKLFRRGHNFYVEDNKSSNGTLINGELVTERRLFGGEEIIIGETYFRFRIM